MRNTDSFQESLTGNCFLAARNGDLHRTPVREIKKTSRSDERGNLIAHSQTPQAKFVKFFTISARLM